MQRLSVRMQCSAWSLLSSSVLPTTRLTRTRTTTYPRRILSTLCCQIRPTSRRVPSLTTGRSFSASASPWQSLPSNNHGRPTTKQQGEVQDKNATASSEAASGKPGALAPRENIYTIPNILTASRLVIAPFIGYCIIHDYHSTALGLLAYAGISDLLDGWIARRWNLGTVVGTVIDPMADKTLMMVLTVSLAVKGALPLWLVALIIGRDVGLGFSAIYYRWISLPPPKTFMRYWDFSLPSAEVRPTTISKYNTFLQLALMGLTTTAPVIPYDLGGVLSVMQYTVAVTTVWSGASYVFNKDAVKILSQAKSINKQNPK